MNWKELWNRPNEFDEPIAKMLEELRVYDPNTVEFEAAMIHLQRLQAMREATRKRFDIPWDAVIKGAATLGTVAIVVMYEQHHAMTSRAKDWAK